MVSVQMNIIKKVRGSTPQRKTRRKMKRVNMWKTQKVIMNLMRMRTMECIRTIAIRTRSRRFALRMNKRAVRLMSKTLVKQISKCIHLSNKEASFRTVKNKKRNRPEMMMNMTKKK